MTYWLVLRAWWDADVVSYRRARWDLLAYCARYGKDATFAASLDIGTLQEFADALDRIVGKENKG